MSFMRLIWISCGNHLIKLTTDLANMRNVVHEIVDRLLPPINSLNLLYIYELNGETGYSFIDQLVINSLKFLL